MTELYIDNNPIVLDDNLSFDFFQKNPAFTRQGEYTYDIDINLDIPQNAQVYYHLDRLHVDKRTKNRRAILIVDCKVLFVGSEIILNVESNFVKIQIVSGYSELNYLASDDKHMRDYDFGEIPEINTSMAVDSLNYIYPEVNYCFTPVYDQYEGVTIFSQFNGVSDGNKTYFNEIDRNTNNGISFVDGANFRAQPYLMYYIDKLPQLLGYTIEQNDLLEDEIATRIICINGSSTREYNRMIPNWKVNEFLTQIELLFNVVFVVDKITKKVSISRTNNFYRNKETIVISKEDIFNSYEKKFDVESEFSSNYYNVKYDFPNSTFYKFCDIDPSVMELCKIEELLDRDIYYHDESKLAQYYDKMILYYNKKSNLYFKIRCDDLGNSIYRYYYEPINQFRQIKEVESEDITELRIVPSEVYPIRVDHWFNYYGDSVIYAPIPFAKYRNESEITSGSLSEAVLNGNKQDSGSDNIYIAIYEGIQPTYGKNQMLGINTVPDGPPFPKAITAHYMSIYYGMELHEQGMNMYMMYSLCKESVGDHTLELLGSGGLEKRYYKVNEKFDTSLEYVIRFRTKQNIDQLSVFVIDNKKFLCKQLKRTVLANGMDELIEGIFYAME